MRLQNNEFAFQTPCVFPINEEAECRARPDVSRLIRLVVAELPDHDVAPGDLITHIRANYPDAQVMFVASQVSATPGAQPEAAVGDALRNGLHAIAGAFVPAVTTVAESAAPLDCPADLVKRLPRRQAEVAVCLVRGLSNKAIAREMGLSESTVKVYVVSIFRSLGVHSRAGAISTILGSPELRRELAL